MTPLTALAITTYAAVAGPPLGRSILAAVRRGHPTHYATAVTLTALTAALVTLTAIAPALTSTALIALISAAAVTTGVSTHHTLNHLHATTRPSTTPGDTP